MALRSYPNPVTAVFLRILAWELYVAKRQLRVQDVATNQVQAARAELGLPPLLGGAAHDFIQKLRQEAKPLLSPRNTPPAPLEPQWASEWRLLYLPSHRMVRLLSGDPVIAAVPQKTSTQGYHDYLITLRDPAIPPLRVTIGQHLPQGKPFAKRRGLYFLRLSESLYIGKSDEFDVRLSGHQQKAPLWWVFISLEQPDGLFTIDALSAAESLLISFWNETTRVVNGNRGGDQQPAFFFLQHAVLFSTAASAVFLWLIRETQPGFSAWNIPFKPWRSTKWPSCYMQIPGSKGVVEHQAAPRLGRAPAPDHSDTIQVGEELAGDA